MLPKKPAMVVEDSQATPQQGAVAVNTLVSVEKLPFVLSAFTGVSKAIAPVGDKAQVVSVNGGSLVAERQVPRASQQFPGITDKVRESQPDAVFIASFGAQQAQIIQQLRDADGAPWTPAACPADVRDRKSGLAIACRRPVRCPRSTPFHTWH